MTQALPDAGGIDADLLTVADLPVVPDLRLAPVAGRAGVGRLVRWTHATELVDPVAYPGRSDGVLWLVVDAQDGAPVLAPGQASGLSGPQEQAQVSGRDPRESADRVAPTATPRAFSTAAGRR